MEVRVEHLPIGSVIPYENNPRRIEAAVGPVMESIKAFGFKVPIVIDVNNIVVAGHTRLEAAKRLGMEEVPVIRATDLTEDQAKGISACRQSDCHARRMGSRRIEVRARRSG